MISIIFVTHCNKATVHAFTSRRTNFPSFKKPHVTTGKIPISLRGDGILFREERTSRESVEAIYPSRWARVRGPTPTYTHTQIYKEDEEARKVESGSPRCHAGCAKGDEGSVPAPFVGAIRPPPPHLPSLFPATQMASQRAHFISASYSRPAWRRKWKQWDTAVIRYRMLVASLNSHLYYLSASKSARANARLLVRAAPSHPFRPPASSPAVSWRPASPRVSPGAYKEVASLPVQKECVERQCRWRFSLNEDFLSRQYFIAKVFNLQN